MLTEADIHALLRDCYDPTIPLNLVDLGCIDHIEISPDPEAPGANISGVPARYRVDITLTPATATAEDETQAAQLTAQIHNRLAGIETISRTTINLTQAPPWTPTRITPAGRRVLGLDNPFYVLNNRAQ